jgi:hypothetical protein
MPWRGPEVPGEVPTLGLVVGQWIQDYCVVPDRELRGRPFILTEEQTIFLVWHYALTEEGKWRYPRGSQLMRPQKWGKGPLVAAICCAEAAGPTLFDGWDAKGEPVGRPWATPHIQVTAGSEDQTANTWRALQPMIEMGPLGETMIPDTGLTRINLAGGGLIEPVTASARSRLGQRITFAVQDETHSWNRSNHGLQLADNQRRNLAGVGGRFVETTNAYDPVEQSVAQRTQSEPGVYIDDVDGGPGSVRNKAERRKVMRKAYGDSLLSRGGWVDLDRIDAEVEALLEHDPAQAERFFLNRKIAMEGAAFDIEQIQKLVRPQKLTGESVVCLGVDGARHDDSLAVVGTDVKTGSTERSPSSSRTTSSWCGVRTATTSTSRASSSRGRTGSAKKDSSPGTRTASVRSRGRCAATRRRSAPVRSTTTATRSCSAISATRASACSRCSTTKSARCTRSPRAASRAR